MLKDAYRFTRTVRIKLSQSTRAYRNFAWAAAMAAGERCKECQGRRQPVEKEARFGGKEERCEGGECVCTAVLPETGGGEGRSYGRQLQNVNASSPC